MSETESVCPSCHTPLLRVNAPTGIRFQCSTCQGVTIALAVFRHVLMDGVGSQVWMKSAGQPEAGHPCGFCTRAMRPVGLVADGDQAATVEVCRVCEMVWVPGDQAALLPMKAAATGATLAQATPPTRCPECGAPFTVGVDGCCPYCHRLVESQPSVVIIREDSGPSAARSGHSAAGTVIGAAASIALGFLSGG